MNLVHYSLTGEDERIGLVDREQVMDLSQGPAAIASWPALLSTAKSENASIEEYIRRLTAGRKPALSLGSLTAGTPQKPPFLLPPVKLSEVWGAGITYTRSREAREEETKVKGIYDRVYDSERPEIFFKGMPRTVVGHNDAIGIRSDASWNVPEPELTFVVGLDGEIIGLTAGNDVCSRDIERENPLFLPQAKIYNRSCALGPTILLGSFEKADLGFTMTVLRNGERVYHGSTRTSKMKRTLEELRSYLLRCNSVPPLSVCLTGTGMVPPDDFTLQAGDEVEIELEKVGKLANKVVTISA